MSGLGMVDTSTDTISLVAVNVGTPRVLADAGGETVWSGIAKSPLPPDARVWLSLVNLAGDGQADLTVHGGRDKAVYAYPSEHLAPWAAELDQPDLGPAPFGENLSTLGVTEHDVCIGDRWAWGDAVLEVSQPRWPCFKLTLHRGRADIGPRMRTTGRTGWYLRVIEPGEVRVGADLSVVHRDPERLSITAAHESMADRHLDRPDVARALAAHRATAEEWRAPLRERLTRHGG